MDSLISASKVMLY